MQLVCFFFWFFPPIFLFFSFVFLSQFQLQGADPGVVGGFGRGVGGITEMNVQYLLALSCFMCVFCSVLFCSVRVLAEGVGLFVCLLWFLGFCLLFFWD